MPENPGISLCRLRLCWGPLCRAQGFFPALLGRPLRLFFVIPLGNIFWLESGRRRCSGPETTGNRYQIAVRIQWTTSRPSISVLFFEIRPKIKFELLWACLYIYICIYTIVLKNDGKDKRETIPTIVTYSQTDFDP